MYHINPPEGRLVPESVLASKQIDQMSRLAETAVCHLTPILGVPCSTEWSDPTQDPGVVYGPNEMATTCHPLTQELGPSERPKHTGGQLSE